MWHFLGHFAGHLILFLYSCFINEISCQYMLVTFPEGDDGELVPKPTPLY